MSRWVKRSSFFVAALMLLGCASSDSVLSVPRQSRVDPRLVSRAQQVAGDRFNVETRTPNGATVVSVNRVSSATLSAIDRGLSELFAVARKNGYRNRLDYTSYIIFVGRPDRVRDSAGNYSPDIAVAAGQYAGSYYDQGGFIYAAGMVLAYNPCAFLIAEHSQNLNRVSDVVRYEGEHLVLYYNDRARYQATADHSRGGGHPILQ
jgi:hypothetical protein